MKKPGQCLRNEAPWSAMLRIFRRRRSGACAVRKDYDLREVFQYINETALFKNQWQLKTASQADYLPAGARKISADLIQAGRRSGRGSGLFEPKVVYGYFPAQGDGNDVVVYQAAEVPSPRHAAHKPRERVLALHISSPA